jgi:hypothetical protein
VYCRNNPDNLVDPKGLAYVDFNVSAGYVIGLTTGLIMDDHSNWHFYFGGGLMVPGIGGSVTASPYDPVSGWNAGLQIELIDAFQAGYSFGKCSDSSSGNMFWETGLGASWPTVGSASLTGYYIWDIK